MFSASAQTKQSTKPIHSKDKALIESLYSGMPLQCSTCGLRFSESNQAGLDAHYDWHFHMNKVPQSKKKGVDGKREAL